MSAMTSRLLITSLALLLAACDIPGMGPDPRIAQREADAKAIGGACRYAKRGIEDCYRLNEKASKTAVFAGWKEMDEYMRENKIEGQRTTVGEEEDAVAETKKPADAAKDKAAEARPRAAASAPAAKTDKK
jgi:hypothetical protein